MTAASPPSVTAAHAVRNFAELRQRAAYTPVFITHHGRPAHVLCSAEQFGALSARRESTGPGVTVDMAQLAAWVDQGVLLIDPAGRVAHANAALLATIPRKPAGLVGRSVFDALPELNGTLAEAYLRRALASRDVATFDMTSPFHDRAWLRCRIAPVGDLVAWLVTDITRDMTELDGVIDHRDLDTALACNEDIALIRLSARASIEQVDRHFPTWIDHADAGLIGRSFCDLIDGPDRLTIRDMLEAVIGRAEQRCTTARLLSAARPTIAVTIGAVRRHSPFGGDGALLVLNRSESRLGDTIAIRREA